jgi:hypothetical protein
MLNKPAKQIYAPGDLTETLIGWGLNPPQPTLVIVGGAGGMSAEQIDLSAGFFSRWLIPFLDRNQIAIIDGGTDSGIMRAMGLAYKLINATLPLIGVIVGAIADQSPDLLEPNHSHFLLTPGADWGDESEWISRLAGALSGGAPSATILMNGGKIAWRDARHSVEARRRVLVVEGSGRTADVIATTSTGHGLDPQAVTLIKSGLVSIINPFYKPEQTMNVLKNLFSGGKNHGTEK